MLPLEDDPRLQKSVDLFNAAEYEDASDLMEDLFVEAVGEELPLARVLLQLCVGMVHVDQGQHAPAIERIEVGIEEVPHVRDWMGIDGPSLTAELQRIVRQVKSGETVERPSIERSSN